MNKRDFVVGSCTTLAAGAALAGPRQEQAVAPRLRRLDRHPDLLASPSLANWQRYVGDRFAAPGGGGLVLQGIERRYADQLGEQFTLRFTATDGANLAEGTHRLRHHTGQRMALYLQPGDLNTMGMPTAFRAEFNRLA